MVDTISQPGCAECGAGGLVLTDYRPYAFLRALWEMSRMTTLQVPGQGKITFVTNQTGELLTSALLLLAGICSIVRTYMHMFAPGVINLNTGIPPCKDCVHPGQKLSLQEGF